MPAIFVCGGGEKRSQIIFLMENFRDPASRFLMYYTSLRSVSYKNIVASLVVFVEMAGIEPALGNFGHKRLQA